ncbi:hypothetical protein [Limnoglobus roseus]|uniref:hypothetical protein n=1 Tax=Limnoglobus roseus TaxID=2598579 RepID=UPI0011EB8E25|nr:hypothetical protein [Limnoglobus roseus]
MYVVNDRQFHADPTEIDMRFRMHGGMKWRCLVREIVRTHAILAARDGHGLTESDREEAVALRDEAMRHLARLIRCVFRLPPVNPETGLGVTVAQAVGLAISYSRFIDQEHARLMRGKA